jgi:hypothetical protein
MVEPFRDGGSSFLQCRASGVPFFMQWLEICVKAARTRPGVARRLEAKVLENGLESGEIGVNIGECGERQDQPLEKENEQDEE